MAESQEEHLTMVILYREPSGSTICSTNLLFLQLGHLGCENDIDAPFILRLFIVL